MQQSEQINELAASLSKAQAKFSTITKNKTVKSGSYSYSYADLCKIIEETKTILAENALSVTQLINVDDDGHEFVLTQLMHNSGQWLRSKVLIKAKDNSPQAMGSGITYARRYSLSAILGISSDEDDDGATAQGQKQNAVKATPLPEPPKQAPKPIPTPNQSTTPPSSAPKAKDNLCTDAQRRKIFACATELGLKDVDIKGMIMRDFGTDSTKNLTKDQASSLIEDLMKA